MVLPLITGASWEVSSIPRRTLLKVLLRIWVPLARLVVFTPSAIIPVLPLLKTLLLIMSEFELVVVGSENTIARLLLGPVVVTPFKMQF